MRAKVCSDIRSHMQDVCLYAIMGHGGLFNYVLDQELKWKHDSGSKVLIQDCSFKLRNRLLCTCIVFCFEKKIKKVFFQTFVKKSSQVLITITNGKFAQL